jgi:hypothetical protein
MPSPHSPDHFGRPLRGRGVLSRIEFDRFAHLGHCAVEILQGSRFTIGAPNAEVADIERAKKSLHKALDEVEKGIPRPEVVMNAWGEVLQSLATIVARTASPVTQVVLEQLSCRPVTRLSGEQVLLLSRSFVDLQDHCGREEWDQLAESIELETDGLHGADIGWFRGRWCEALQAVAALARDCGCSLSHLLLDEMDDIEEPWMLSVS